VFLLNLSLMEFMTLFGAASALVVALYLLNRSRKKQQVATLKFWRTAENPTIQKHRRRIQQPLSLILQLVSIALLLLAIAQLRLGNRETGSRDHVLILDTSSWMGARSDTGRSRDATLLDEAKVLANSYIHALPSADRVMVIRADGLATPVTGFEINRGTLEAAIGQSRPGAAALNLEQALAFAGQVEKLHAQHSGEIVFVGAGRVKEQDGALTSAPPANFRVIPVKDKVENCGLRKIGLRRSATDPGLWEVFVAARNYGTVARIVPLALQFGGGIVGSRKLLLTPGKDEEATFTFRTRAAGWLEARLLIDDGLPDDNRAIVELPAQRPLKVSVYTREPQLLRPEVAANSMVEAQYFTPEEYKPASDAKIVIFDRFRPEELPKVGSIWIEPPSNNSPVPIRTTVNNALILRWRPDHDLGAGLRTKQVKLDSTEVFAAEKGDIPVAEIQGGPVILARPGAAKMVVMGFHPGRSAMRFDLATPLLFANILRWMEPDAFRRWELIEGSVGTVSVPLESDVDAASIRVIAEDQRKLPFTVHGKTMSFFAGDPGTVRVLSESREQVYSLTLPEVGEKVWTLPAAVKHGVPSRFEEASTTDLWQLLALLGGAGLLIEWLMFGRTRIIAQAAHPEPKRDPLRRAS
jgi:hypothetical protein